MGDGLAGLAEDGRRPETTAETEDAWGVVYDALENDQQRDAIRLVFHDGLTREEAAVVMEVGERTLYRLLARSCIVLRQGSVERALGFIVTHLKHHGPDRFFRPIELIEGLRTHLYRWLHQKRTPLQFTSDVGMGSPKQIRVCLRDGDGVNLADCDFKNIDRKNLAKERNDRDILMASAVIGELLSELSRAQKKISDTRCECEWESDDEEWDAEDEGWPYPDNDGADDDPGDDDDDEDEELEEDD